MLDYTLRNSKSSVNLFIPAVKAYCLFFFNLREFSKNIIVKKANKCLANNAFNTTYYCTSINIRFRGIT